MDTNTINALASVAVAIAKKCRQISIFCDYGILFDVTSLTSIGTDVYDRLVGVSNFKNSHKG